MILSLEAVTLFLSHPFVAIAFLASAFLIHAGLIVRYIAFNPRQQVPLLLVLLSLTGALLNNVCDLGMLIKLTLFGSSGDIPLFTFLCRVTWSLFLTSHQSLILLFEYLLTKKITITPFHIVNGLFNAAISGSFLYLAIAYYGVSSANSTTLPFELRLTYAAYAYLFVLYSGLIVTLIRKLTSRTLPKILHAQIRYLARYVLPLQATLLCDGWNSFFRYIPLPGISQPVCSALGTLLSSYCLYIMGRKIIGLRFLNMRSEITTGESFNFLRKFKDILEQMSYATALNELGTVTQSFFHRAFNLGLGRTHLHVLDATKTMKKNTLPGIEKFLTKDDSVYTALLSAKILIRDDIEFTRFYKEDPQVSATVDFLDAFNADIFIPLFERSTLVAYIVVERDARPSQLFTSQERDEMLVFTTYLSNVIALLKHSSLEALLLEKKELSEELYHKHQEISHYKELIRSTIRSHSDRKIGIIFYKHRIFTLANESAHTFIDFDLNKHHGHPLTKICTTTARRVLEFKAPQNALAQDTRGNKLVIAGIPSSDGISCILLLYHPHLADLAKEHQEFLKDPSRWDYALYLETTNTGRLITQLIPGTSEALLTYKIDLLSAALSRKAVLLTTPDDDLSATVELLHVLSFKKTLSTIELTHHEQNNTIARRLFGVNQLIDKDAQEGLLEKLDSAGTLFIKNIEFLALDTQQDLAQYLRCGYFSRVKSVHKVVSSVRILCSTHQDLQHLTQEGTFSPELLAELQPAAVTMPLLRDLSDDDIASLVQGFTEQLISADTYKSLLTLSEKDTRKFIEDRPVSLHEFKERIHQRVAEKAESHNLEKDTLLDPGYTATNPTVAHALRLGKKALRDRQMMNLLWNKFKNQNKIAQLLGVNRSSVNRRCQEFNLR